MKLSKVTQTFRSRTESLYGVNKNIIDGRYRVEWIHRNKIKMESIIEKDALGYPIENIGAREHVDASLTLYLPQEWFERLGFLNEGVKFEGLKLSEFDDPGFYESLQVTILVASPNSSLDPSLI